MVKINGSIVINLGFFPKLRTTLTNGCGALKFSVTETNMGNSFGDLLAVNP
jgi:hypothetical protein